MKLFAKLAAAAALLTAAQAQALVIDFGATPWTPNANNQQTYTDGITTATAGPVGALIFAADSRDGLGVTCTTAICGGVDEFDEVNGTESLTISFATAVKLLSVKVTDFFPKIHDNVDNDGSHATGEVGYIKLWNGLTDLGVWTIYGVNSVITSWEGDQVINFGGQTVTAINFYTGGARDEFSVKSITAEVAEPGLLGLLGLGMLCLGLSRRRQAKAA